MTLAGITLELAVLAFVSRAMEFAVDRQPYRPPAFGTASAQPAPLPEALPEFIAEVADTHARYYRGGGEASWLVVGRYGDGRIRIVDGTGRRFAGSLDGDRAEMTDLTSGRGCVAMLRYHNDGALELKMHGEPYDGRTLVCETFGR
jgi:hypothetical protein